MNSLSRFLGYRIRRSPDVTSEPAANTDASPTDETIREPLPAQNIIAGPRGAPLSPASDSDALGNLLERPRQISSEGPKHGAGGATQRFTPDVSHYQEHAAGTPGYVGKLELSPPVPYESGSTLSGLTLSDSTLSSGSTLEVQALGSESGVPAAATDPAGTLFNALPGLNPELRKPKE